jgi:Ca2+-dependent lipid-binding protein
MDEPPPIFKPLVTITKPPGFPVLSINEITAQDLIPKDTNGFSDPYAVLFYTDKLVGKTPVFPKTLAPKFECACPC